MIHSAYDRAKKEQVARAARASAKAKLSADERRKKLLEAGVEPEIVEKAPLRGHVFATPPQAALPVEPTPVTHRGAKPGTKSDR